MDDKLRAELNSVVELWKRFWGDNLHSIHLYGSMARGDWSKRSDVNLVLFLKEHDYSRWDDAASMIRRKVKKGFAIPLLLSENYLRSSLDVYPIEFLDMKLFHETLHGSDVFESIEIDPAHLRLQAEREIKGKWVALRQAALELSGSTSAIRDLMAMSVPTWNAVFQALLVIAGKDVPADKHQLVDAGCELAGLDSMIFHDLIRVRNEGKSVNRNEGSRMLTRVLEQVDRLAVYADNLSVRQA